MTVTLREVEQTDWDFILKLRNDKKYRKNFYNQHTITKKEHYTYLKKQKKNPNFVQWIITYNNDDVGYVRILDSDVSIIVDKKYNNKGIGTNALSLIETKAKKLGIKKLVGRVMIGNKNSKEIFLKNNYKLLMLWLEKDIK